MKTIILILPLAIAGSGQTDVNARVELDRFFAAQQAKSYGQILLAVKNSEDAKDLLQEAMIKLTRKYADQQENWPKLFQRIVQNQILDWHRRKKVRRILFWFQQSDAPGENLEDKLPEQASLDSGGFRQLDITEPDSIQENQQKYRGIMESVSKLPLRQQQAFLLRAWHGHSTKETAEIMDCSAGSVKTHYSRATASLRDDLKALSISL